MVYFAEEEEMSEQHKISLFDDSKFGGDTLEHKCPDDLNEGEEDDDMDSSDEEIKQQ